jgi:Asp-tRNA(Asn)/Glu-tRNA(Gln) amidotransferase A subunit family amidase
LFTLSILSNQSCLKGSDDALNSVPKVQIYVMGRNQWRSENEWPLARTKYTPLYLNADGAMQIGPVRDAVSVSYDATPGGTYTSTTPRVAEPWGRYNLGRSDVSMDDLAETLFRWSCQFTLPHNVAGIPAMSLPLAMHSTGLPIGVQLASRPACEHVILQLAASLEEARPWADRVPPLSVANV